jgi:signal transduction histidine kinase
MLSISQRKINSTNFFELLAGYFWPQQPFERDIEKIAAIHIFLRTVAIVLILRFGFMLVYLASNGWTPLLYIWLIHICIMFSSLVIFKFQQKLTIAAHVPVISFFVNYCLQMWSTGGLSSPIVVVVPSVVFYVVVIMGVRASMLYTFLFMATMLVYYYLDAAHILPKVSMTGAELNINRVVSYMFAAALFLWTFSAYRQVFLTLRDMLKLQRQESSRLLQIISHDLRSPLQIVHSYAQLLPDVTSKEKMNDYLASMQKSLDRITNVLDQVRMYEGFMGGKKLVELAPVDLKETTEYVIEALHQQSAAKNITVNLNAQGISYQVLADQVALTEHIFVNFLTNAIKFSPEGSTIDINLIQYRTFVVVEFRDYGIGMPPDILNSMFNFSKSITRPGTHGEKGTGFGMPIAKIFLDQMGIEVAVTSREEKTHPNDHGTTVTLKFKSYY